MREAKICFSCQREYRQAGDFLVGTSRWRRSAAGHYWFYCTCGATLAIPAGHLTWFMPLSILGPGSIGALAPSEEDQVLSPPIGCGGCKRDYASSWDVLSGTTRTRLCSSGYLWFNCGCGQTLKVHRGQSTWYSPADHMNSTARGLYESLPDKSLIPRVSSTLAHAQQVVTQPDSSATDIAHALKDDPLVAVELLRMADLLVATTGNQVKTIEHAVILLRRQAIADILTASAIKVTPIRTKAFSSDFFWREAVLVGKIAEHLGQDLLPEVPGDHIFLAGALCNIGKIVAAIVEPDTLDKVFIAAIDPAVGMPWKDAESKNYGTSHVVLGELIAHLWGFPDFVCDAIKKHHFLNPDPKVAPNVSDVVSLAVGLAHNLAGNGRRHSSSDRRSIGQKLGLTPATGSALLTRLRSQVLIPLEKQLS